MTELFSKFTIDTNSYDFRLIQVILSSHILVLNKDLFQKKNKKLRKQLVFKCVTKPFLYTQAGN